jgi:putative MATE family efflux protein
MGNLNHNILDTDKIGRLLLTLSLPAFLGMFVQTLYNVVNTIFIGHFVGPLAIAGLSIVFPLQMLSMGVGMMVGLGGTSLISRSLGAGDHQRAERVLGNGVTLSIVFAIVMAAIILLNVDFWLRLIGASEHVLPFARDYLVIIMAGSVFNTFAMALLNFARGEGNARVGMSAMVVGGVLNIILDAIFIIWLGMGVKGAALATIIGQTTAMLYLISYYLTGSSYLKIRTANLRPDLRIIKSMLAIGVASFVQTVAGSLSAMFVIRLVVTLGGDIALSAFGIIQRITMFALMPAIVLGQGAQPILGFNYGARRFGLAIKSMIMAHVTATCLSVIVYLVLYLIPGPIVSIFTTDQDVVAQGIYIARRVFVALPIIGTMMVGTASFQALGKATHAFVTAISRPLLFMIPAALLMSRFFGIDGLWFSFPTSDLLTFFLTVTLTIPIIREFRKAAAAKAPAEELAQVPL